MARSFGCAPSTVTRLSARLGRHTLLLHTLALRHLAGRLSEPLAADHFETFEFSQDFPFGVLTLVGRDSWFVYGLDPAPHARGGKVTPYQAVRLAARPRIPRRGGYRGSFRRGLDVLLPLSHSTVEIACDGKEPYMLALRKHPQRDRIRLEVHPNPVRGPKGAPRSRQALARDRAMYAVDQLHMLLRHSRADHKRETMAFGRRLNAILERLHLAIVWRNFIKGRSERRPDPDTPGMRLGLSDCPWTWRRVLARRLFPCRASLTPVLRDLYWRNWRTPILPTNHLHRLRHAA